MPSDGTCEESANLANLAVVQHLHAAGGLNQPFEAVEWLIDLRERAALGCEQLDRVKQIQRLEAGRAAGVRAVAVQINQRADAEALGTSLHSQASGGDEVLLGLWRSD